jgi:hypothetical protein
LSFLAFVHPPSKLLVYIRPLVLVNRQSHTFRITKHTHHPVDDAKGNAEAMLAMIKEFDLKIRL